MSIGMGKNAKTTKRVLILSDLHCGHRAGLTPKKWWGNLQYDKWAELRSQLWVAYSQQIQKIRPIDICIINGDCIDGRGERSGSTELITADRHEQCDIATQVILYTKADTYAMTRGTPYHTGESEDFEDVIARNINATAIKNHMWPDVNGVVFDIRHKVGSTTVPYGKGTAISKERFWNLVHNEFAQSQPKADIIVRSHVHYFFHVEEPHWHGFITPSLQGLGSKYGGRQVSQLVHFGFIWFDIKDRETWLKKPTWQKWILTGEPQQKRKLIL